jgi:hypothetical protein
MNPTKTILAATAASLLGAAGAASAATVGTDSVTTTGSTLLSTTTGSGSGTLLSTGTYTIDQTQTTSVALLGATATITEIDTFTGTYAGGVFTPSSGTIDNTSCTGPTSSALCGADTLNNPTAFSSVGGSFVFTSGGTLTSTIVSSGETDAVTYTVGKGIPASTVPLPPAVMLLGSGLLGLVGTARRRRTVTPA